MPQLEPVDYDPFNIGVPTGAPAVPRRVTVDDLWPPRTPRYASDTLVPRAQGFGELKSRESPPTEALGDWVRMGAEKIGAGRDYQQRIGSMVQNLAGLTGIGGLADLAYHNQEGNFGEAAWAAPAIIPGAGGGLKKLASGAREGVSALKTPDPLYQGFWQKTFDEFTKAGIPEAEAKQLAKQSADFDAMHRASSMRSGGEMYPKATPEEIWGKEALAADPTLGQRRYDVMAPKPEFTPEQWAKELAQRAVAAREFEQMLQRHYAGSRFDKGHVWPGEPRGSSGPRETGGPSLSPGEQPQVKYRVEPVDHDPFALPTVTGPRPAVRAGEPGAPASGLSETSVGFKPLEQDLVATGSKNPLDEVPVTFRGKEPKDFTPQDWQEFGQHHGVENMGPLSPLQKFRTTTGEEFALPGGTEGTWTYADLLHMKANPINPANVDRALHTEMQKKLGRTMTPKELTDADVWNGLVFGMTSPNNPLLPNQITASRLRLRTPQMLDDLASMVPWKAGETPTKQQRKIVNDQIASRFGLDAASKGGLGTRGTADYSRVAEMAQLFRENPEFFRKMPDESWTQAVERISSQLPGLSMKTGSFGTVWQAPAEAAISAIDRHMARELEKRGGIFVSAKERTAWENRSVDLWNTREEKRVVDQTKKAAKTGSTRPIAPANVATDFDNMLAKSGSDGFVGEMLLDHVGKALTPKFRGKGGEINPNLPPHLAKADWVREPQSVFKVGRAYKQALEVNQKIADEHGLNLFMSQWMEWDRIRNRFEPHENMFPGLSNLPAPSKEQLRAVDRAHAQTGHKTYGKTEEGTLKPTRPYAGNPSQLGYLGLAGAAALPALDADEEER